MDEMQQLLLEEAERKKREARGAHRMLYGFTGAGALGMAAVCYALRVVPADKVKNIPAHIDGRITLAAIFFAGLGLLMLVGAAGFINIGNADSLSRQMKRKGVFGPDRSAPPTGFGPQPAAPLAPAAPSANEPLPSTIDRWTD